MRRKDFLIRAAAIMFSSSLSGCDWFADPKRLRILGLTGAIPGRVVKEFEEKFSSKSVEIKTEASPEAIWKLLKEISKPEFIPDVVSLGDAWLDLAIANKLIAPISAVQFLIPRWANLAPIWQQAATRNGQIWGIPYRWGATAIAYRSDRIDFAITSWADLWRPELKGRLTLPDDAREVIGLTLKKLGHSYKTADLQAISALKPELQQLHSQVLTYTSDTYLQPLLIGDSWAAVGWSQDLIKAARQNPGISVVIPTEGTALWVDMWTLPLKKSPSENYTFAQNWMNFGLEQEIANQITALTSANATNFDFKTLPKNVTEDRVKFFDPQIFAKSELILPLAPATNQEYLQTWENLRKS